VRSKHPKNEAQNKNSKRPVSALSRTFPTPRHAVNYIMDTFPIVKRKDEG